MKKTLTYSDYLQLDQLFALQTLQSALHGDVLHDELFFIITHQVYELWFKQINAELDAIIIAFHEVQKNIQSILQRLKRINKIQQLLIHQLDVLETLSPEEFLRFRDYLTQASGYQSYQFRLMEIKLGVHVHSDLTAMHFFNCLVEAEQKIIMDAATSTNLLLVVNHWLTHLYHPLVIFDNNEVFFSQQALANANEINTNKHLSQHQCNYQLIKALIAIDDLFIQWRQEHALMAQRMIGVKMGTAGTSGVDYLQRTVTEKRIFSDLKNIFNDEH